MNYLTIADWTLEATLAGSVLVVIIMLIKKVFKNKLNVTAHYYIWILLIIKLMVPSGPESKISLYNVINPTYSSNFYGSTYENTANAPVNNVQPVYENKNADNNSNIKSTEINETMPAEAIDILHSKINYKKLFFIIWVIGVVLASARTISGIVRIKKITLSSKSNNDKLNNILEEAKQTVNIKRKIQLGLTNQISSPSLFGVFNPLILIPNKFADTLSDRELKYIIIHELCHVKRKDIIISWLKVIFKTIHWFNPLIILGLHTMEKDCEISCDNTALSYLGNSENKAYGSTIINVLELVNKPMWLPGSTSIIMRKNDLKRRIKMISNYGKISIGSTFTGIVIILIVAAVGLTDKIAKADISNNTQSSINAVSAKSLSIILTDNEEGLKDNTRVASYYPNLYPYLVHFQDIKDITGELKNLGAVNISVNGESITESSDISTEGQFIKINGSRYKPPFTVKAEWNKDISSDSLLKDSSIISNLKSRGLVVKIYEPENKSDMQNTNNK